MSTRLPFATAIGGLLVVLLALPVVGLFAQTRPAALLAALALPSTRDALVLSLWTSSLSLAVVAVLGTPLAWSLSRRARRWHGPVRAVVELPMVLPPSVLGLALLQTFGRQGLFGPALEGLGITIPFSSAAVVLAQIIVGAPLFVLTATSAFRVVDDDLLLVARTLGATRVRAWLSVALPCAAPGLVSAAALAWARGLGEFGATLLFAGNLQGRTQTLPLAIYGAMERDVAQAHAIALVLVLVALTMLSALRAMGRDVG